MKPKVAAAVEFVVGLFLSPAAWVMLVAMTAGRAAMNSLNSLSTAGLADRRWVSSHRQRPTCRCQGG